MVRSESKAGGDAGCDAELGADVRSFEQGGDRDFAELGAVVPRLDGDEVGVACAEPQPTENPKLGGVERDAGLRMVDGGGH